MWIATGKKHDDGIEVCDRVECVPYDVLHCTMALEICAFVFDPTVGH